MKKAKLLIIVFLIIAISSGVAVRATEANKIKDSEETVLLFDAKKEPQHCLKFMKLEDFKKIIEKNIIGAYKENELNKSTINDGIIITINKDEKQKNYHFGYDGILRKCRISLTYCDDGFIDDGFEFMYDEVYLFNSSVNESLWEKAEEILYEDIEKEVIISDNWLKKLRPVVYPSEGISYLEEIYEKGVLPFDIGVDDGEKFYITREEYCKLIFNFLKRTDNGIELTKENIFEDVVDKRIGSLAQVGIVKGIEKNLFNPSSYLTREEAAVFLKRTADYLDINFVKKKLDGFKDDEEISIWAKSDIYALASSEIIKGEENGNFSPKKNLNRFDALRLIVRLIDLHEEKN